MANLTGVKTIDMQGGEITKVAHGGAEYELFEGMPQVGDLIRPHYDHWHGNPSGFYVCHAIDGDGDAEINTELQEADAHFRRYYDVFRKVKSAAVSAPFAEMIASKVDAVEKRVSALEGAQEPLKIGDRVRISGKSRYGANHDGEVGELKRIDEDGSHSVVLPGGLERLYKREQLTKVASAPAQKLAYEGATYELVERKAQAGDVVVFTENTSPYFTNGKAYGPVVWRGIVAEVKDNHGDSLRVYFRDYNRTEANTLVYEPKAIAPAKPKTGDIVVITANTNGSANKVGDIGKVGRIGNSMKRAEVLVPGGDMTSVWTEFNEMRHATPAEIAQYHKSADIAALKEGDFITIDTLEYDDDITEGRAYEVRKDCGGLYFHDDRGGRRYSPISEGAFAKVYAPKLEVGDYVVIMKSEKGNEGKVAKITGRDYKGFDYTLQIIGESGYYGSYNGWLRKATDDEVKASVFANLGRKPNEFRKGDIVRGERSLKRGEHVVGELESGRVDNNRTMGIFTFEGEFYAIHADTAELIAPVESRVDAP